jgi:hypothetical protein
VPHRLPNDLPTAKYDELQERFNYDNGRFSEVTEYSIVGLSGLVNLLLLAFDCEDMLKDYLTGKQRLS